MASNLEPKINRIATAVTSALSALTAKGVTVPEGANVESLAALIGSIEAGGGMETIFDKKWEYGSITPTEDITANYTINFKNEYLSYEGSAYGYFFMFCDGKTAIPNQSWIWIANTKKGPRSEAVYGQYVNSSGGTANASYMGVIGSLNAVSYKVYCTSSKMLCAGRTYNWIMIGAKGGSDN